MIICFDATAEAKKALDSVMEGGQFRDISEATSMALVSYAALFKAHKSGGQAGLNAAVQHPYNASSLDVREPSQTSKPTALKNQIPDLFTLQNSSLDDLQLPLLAIDESDWKVIPPSKWLFGQFNKFLPVKVTCRGLLNLMRDNPKGIPLDDAKDKIADTAWELGDFLYMVDERQVRSRENALASAFPVTAGNGSRSRLRFANQFVGTISRDNLSGLPASLRFACVNNVKENRLGLTRAGAEFAILESPVLDGDADRATSKFSDAELHFLLNHIKHFIPQETSAYIAILDAIEKGANNPDEMDEYLCQRFGLEKVDRVEEGNEKQIARTFLTTQRTGAISRMADLELIGKEKDGLRVTYLHTDSGKKFRLQAATTSQTK